MTDVLETDWAYLAGMIDGDGCICIIRHYKHNPKWSMSNRGYELEPKMDISNMNKDNINEIHNIIKLGTLTSATCFKSQGRGRLVHRIAFSANDQRIMLPKLLPYLKQKKGRAQVLLDFLTYRQTLHKNAIERETKYLEFEKQMIEATFKEKPWLSSATAGKGRRSNRIKVMHELFNGINPSPNISIVEKPNVTCKRSESIYG